jgi:uncharacterized protein (TIGR02453 family)
MRFSGFAKDAMKFWFELSAEMSKEWFAEHKARYESTWAGPMSELLDEVAASLRKTYAPLVLTPKVLRIHRDVRFSKDKAPYKTHIGAAITVGKASLAGSGFAAAYLHIGVEDGKAIEFSGVGGYQFEAKQLATWRKQVDGAAGAALARQVASLRERGYDVGGHDDLKKVPKPYDPDHPRAELLKMKGLTAGFPAIPKGTLHKAALADWVVEHARATAPLIKWLSTHVGAAESR